MAETKKTAAEQPKTYEVFVPINPADPKDDVLPVGVNGKTYLVKRGMSVQVPAEVYAILKFKRLTYR